MSMSLLPLNKPGNPKFSWPTQQAEVARLLDNGEIKAVLTTVTRCTEKRLTGTTGLPGLETELKVAPAGAHCIMKEGGDFLSGQLT